MYRQFIISCLASGLVASSGCEPSIRDCSTVDTAPAEALPQTLSETGLYADIQNDVVAEDAIAFKPRFPLWTDGADKRRWLLLPEGTQVDTSDTEDWAFPVGTKTFKEFTRDGVRVETRMNLKTEDGWAAVAYIWNASGDDAEQQIEPAENVSGTGHDVPGAAQCAACHGGRRNFTLGFSATQLDVETRASLFDEGVLSDPVETQLQLPPTVEEGLGVLHGNCAHCHNAERAQQVQATACFNPEPENFDLTLPSHLADLENSPAFLTARFELGESGDSDIVERMAVRNLSEEEPSMPPLGTELVDEDGVSKVEALIEELPPNTGGR